MTNEPKQKKNYIKYTPEQLAAVPTPAQKEEQSAAGVVKSMGLGAAIGAVAGTVLGIGPATGAVAGGTIGTVKGAKDGSK